MDEYFYLSFKIYCMDENLHAAPCRIEKRKFLGDNYWHKPQPQKF